MTWLREKWDSERRMSDERKGDTVDTMTDLHERAKQVMIEWFDNCTPNISELEGDALVVYITAALEQVREECAKVAETYFPFPNPTQKRLTDDIAAAIRQGVARGRREP